MAVWSTVVVAIVVGGGLQNPPPFGEWADSWGRAPLPFRALAAVAVVAFLTSAARQLLVHVTLGELDAPIRLLPLSRTERFALDWCTAAMFTAVPLIAGSILAIVGDLHTGHSVVGSSLSAILINAAAITSAAFSARNAGPRMLAAACSIAAAACACLGPAGFVAAVVLLGVTVAFGTRVALEERAPAGSAVPTSDAVPPLVLPPPLRLLAEELRWVTRTAPSLLTSVLVSMALMAGAALAVRNNAVHATVATIRIWTFAAALATLFVAYPLVRSRVASLRHRQLEELLPTTAARRFAIRLLTATLYLVPLIVTAAFFAGVAATLCVVAETVLLLAAILFIAERAARLSLSRDLKINLGTSSVALTMGLHPLLGYAVLVLFGVSALRDWQTAQSLDFPRFTEDES